MVYKVLLADDEQGLRDITKKYLERNGFDVITAKNGAEAIAAVDKNVFDIIVLDIMMPEIDGRQVCQYIRTKYDVPVIFLTALGKEQDVIQGYEIGADEYVTKPFSMPILMAKINSLVKRYHGLTIKKGLITIGNIQIEPARRIVTVNKKVISIAPKEYELLMYFIDNKNQVLSRTQILDAVWGYDYEGYDRAVDTHVKKLRAILGEENHFIHTIIKGGYIWRQ
ncbi:MAG: response regulator transcription factor [Eubacterium sp.]|uniref:response regulator transcription factor n=1 Tax=Eubacterium sp. TaxID=142586 RepID=UPI00399C26CD